MQKERDIFKAKLEVYEKKEIEAKKNKEKDLVVIFQEEENKNVDECILDIKCQGDCDPEVHHAPQMRSKQIHGGKRSFPHEYSVNIVVQKCPQCEMGFQKNVSLQKHVKHVDKPNCLYCNVGLWNLDA